MVSYNKYEHIRNDVFLQEQYKENKEHNFLFQQYKTPAVT